MSAARTALLYRRALESFVDEGLVRSIGVSNCSLPQVEQLLESGRIKPSVNQVELHPLLAQRKLVGVSWRKGVVSVGYGPLGGQKSKEVLEHPLVKQIAEETGKTSAQVRGVGGGEGGRLGLRMYG